MPYYRKVGDVPRKRHTQFRAPDGSLYAEELMGQEGFSAASSLLYHRYAPTALLDAEAVTDDPALSQTTPNHPLLPYHFHTTKAATGADMVLGRAPLLANDDVRISVARPTAPSPLYRNGTGDELIYIRDGRLRLESTFGALECQTGDYVVVPTATVHRWIPLSEGTGETYALVVEATGHIGPPERYLSRQGQFLEHSPYCERDLHGPEAPLLVDAVEIPLAEGAGVEVLVRQLGGLTRYTYAHHPFDVVGWDGCVYPYRFSVHDFEPITGRVHQPPPVHQTFAGPRFVVCSFVPRKLDYHPQSVPAPYNHANVDSDEVLYYCEGNFTSRRGAGISAGSMSLHPSGHIHGPQPGSVEASLGKESTDELAVMIDTFRPLRLTEAARSCAASDYPWTWSSTT